MCGQRDEKGKLGVQAIVPHTLECTRKVARIHAGAPCMSTAWV